MVRDDFDFPRGEKIALGAIVFILLMIVAVLLVKSCIEDNNTFGGAEAPGTTTGVNHAETR